MSGFTIYTGNMLEKLAEKLGESLKKSSGSPFETELIIVQSQGITQWLTIKLAGLLGIWSNFNYMLPNRFNHSLFKMLCPELPDSRYMDTGLLRWQLMKLIPENLDKSSFSEIRSYLSGDSGRHKLFQLAGKISDLFDQYLTFRPGMILEWERGSPGGWQGELWRRAVTDNEILHPPALREMLAKEIKDKDFPKKYKLPSRISLFGISYLPPFHLDIMKMLSRHIEIDLYIFSPTNQFWSHIMPERSIIKRSRKAARKGIPEEDLHMESGNSLLSSMGRAGRDFFGIIADDEKEPVELYSHPGSGTLLKEIQRGIFNLEERILPEEEGKMMAGDGSIIINSCHSPMRESEVLYEYLLHQFNIMDDLKPHEILIVTPDIESYAPFIHAVFSTPEKEEMKIPVAINRGGVSHGSGTAGTFFSILELEKKRYSAGSILDLLESPPVSRNYGFTTGCREKINSWVESCNIRWGLGSQYREEIGLPPVENNSWIHGIKRLLLGYSLSEGEGELPGGILPFPGIEGEDARLLGRFNSFLEAVMDAAEIFKDPHTLKEWSRHLGTVLESFTGLSADDDPQFNYLNRGISLLSEYQETSGFCEEIDLSTITEYLREYIEVENPSGRYVTGAVTASSTLPVRTIPWRIICMIGMNHNLFPRSDFESPFDLMKKDPRRGDRSLRDEDRYIFLESILSAREKLYISYTGQDIQDNSEIPPSVAVSELIDHIAGIFPARKETQGRFFFRHPLHSFSSRYFQKESPFISYSRENLNALVSRERGDREKPFINRPLDSGGNNREIELGDLVSFFMHPVKYLLKTIIGVDYDLRTFIPENSEPFEVKGLDKYLIESKLVDGLLSGKNPDRLLERCKQEGVLPHGSPGDIEFRRLFPGIREFSSRVAAYVKGDIQEPLEISLDLEGVRIRGTVYSLYNGCMAHYRYTESRGKDFIRPWIEHLAVSCSGKRGLSQSTVVIHRNRVWELGQVNDPGDILKDLVSLYLKGIREPLPFFPNTSYSYAETMDKGKPEETALKDAIRSMSGSEFTSGDLEDPYNARCFTLERINFKEFKDLSQRVFGPIINSRDAI